MRAAWWSPTPVANELALRQLESESAVLAAAVTQVEHRSAFERLCRYIARPPVAQVRPTPHASPPST